MIELLSVAGAVGLVAILVIARVRRPARPPKAAEEPATAAAPESAMKRPRRWLGCLSALLLCGCMGLQVVAFDFTMIGGTFELALGWIVFIVEAAPHVRVRAEPLVIAAIATAILGFGGHALLRGWASSRGREPWPVRRTVALLAVPPILFAAGLSWGGISRHVVQLMESDAPLKQNSWQSLRFVSGRFCREVQRASKQGQGAASIALDVRRNIAIYAGHHTLERHHVVVVDGTNGVIAQAFVFARDPASFTQVDERPAVCDLTTGEPRFLEDPAELEALLASVERASQ